jgi:hypothetical protein
MSAFSSEPAREFDALMRNAELRNALEPFFDDAILHINSEEIPTEVENEYLAGMLAWERAPVLPIAEWFEPELKLPRPDSLNDEQLHEALWDVVQRLYDKRIVLDFTDHLNDRQLYCLIYRDILPSPEKKVDLPTSYLHWDCADASGDPETYLRYYATQEEREAWLEENDDVELPVSEAAPFPRRLPHEPERE